MDQVVRLADVSLIDASRVGRKAAVLGALMRAGFAVPDGVAVTVDALSATIGPVAEHDGVDLAALIRSTAIPEPLVTALRAALETLGGGPVAVRSSGVDEDLAGMSYAGQYESVLNVSGLDAVCDAVRDCWASGVSERVSAYGGARSGLPRLGVIIQSMVPAEAAGVAFGGNPVTGARDETLISAVRGLGDRLMAGHSDADEWTVSGGRAALNSGAGDAVDTAAVHRIADLTNRVSAHLGAPQDIEWAIAGDEVWLLQARPITAFPSVAPAQVPIAITVPAGFSNRNRNIDRPWTPIERSVFLPVFSASARHIFAYTTGMVPSANEIGGWVYITVGADDANAFADRLESIADSVAAGAPRRTVESWHRVWKPAYARDIGRLHDVQLSGLSDPALDRHARDIRCLFDTLHDHYFRLTGAAIVLLGELGVVCAELLNWSAPETLRLRSGLVGDHMAATTGISDLAAHLAANPTLRDKVTGEDVTVDDLAGIDPAFAAAFTEALHRHGHRTMGFDLTEPTLAERPAILLSLVRAQVGRPYDFAAERAALEARIDAALTPARATLTNLPEPDRARFEAALDGSMLSSSVRDEKSYYAVGAWALIRYVVLELGRRLAERGAIDQAADAMFLEYDEALVALADGVSRRDLIARRRGEHAWALAHPGPPSYGNPPAPLTPDPERTVSAGAEHAMRVAQWSMSVMGGPPPRGGGDRELCGVAASPGRYLGTVRVVERVADFGRVRPGDVLVCPETTAQWAMVFPTIGALVTDRGSLLSHPAILAREYGVPAVVATGTATRTLHDGQLVLVDGDAGKVRIVADDLIAAGTINGPSMTEVST